jgi:ComF family protein
MQLFTPCCVLCDTKVTQNISLCAACLQDLPRIIHSCYRCALPLQNEVVDTLCGECQQSPPPVDYLISSLHYAYPVGYLISQLKFQRHLSHAKIFSQLLLTTLQAYYIKPSTTLPDVIIPVPLHKKRIRQRGFNQALEIARPIAKGLDIPILGNVIQRTKYTQAQSLLSAVERRKNLRRSFAVVKPITADHIVLLDDVVTTGTTVYELAILLKKQGVKTVGVWAVARATHHKTSL